FMALIELIGIREVVRRDRETAVEVVRKFWEICKGTALWSDAGVIRRLIAFSDSALLTSVPGAAFVDFATAAVCFAERVHDSVHDCFLVLASGEQIEPSQTHEHTARRVIGNDSEPTYTFVAGMGDAFANLFAVQKAAPEVAGEDPQFSDRARLYVP